MKNRRKLMIHSATFALLSLCVVLTSCSNSSPKPTEDPPVAANTLTPIDQVINVGVLAPVTGFMSGHGRSIEMGTKLAAEYINNHGGAGGKKIVLHVADTKSDPGVTAERAKELIERNKVSLLLGTGTSASTLAAIAPATTAGSPFIYTLDGECKTCAVGDKSAVSPYIWGSGFTERMIVKPYLEFLAKLLNKPLNEVSIYLVGGDYVYPRTTNDYARQVAEELGLKVLGEQYSDTATKDYSPLLRKILAAKPDILIVTNPGSSGVTFMRQARQLALENSVLIGGFATFDQEAIEAMGTASEGVYCVNRYSNKLDNDLNREFVAAFRKAYPKEDLLPGPTVAAGAYGALIVAAKAFEKAGVTGAEEFRAAMAGLEVDLPQGKVRVNAKNNIFDQPIYIMQIKNQRYEVVSDIGLQTHPGFEGCSVE